MMDSYICCFYYINRFLLWLYKNLNMTIYKVLDCIVFSFYYLFENANFGDC